MSRYAAVDIGSNSVRMLAAEVLPGNPPQILASDREVTRIGASVFRDGRVSSETIDVVCAVLRRMAETYRKLDVVAVRAVATSAIRDASNQGEFVARASEALAAPVEIISGPEEARLIYLGVQSRWPHPDGRLLIVDVGGGSAEFILGEGGEMKEGISRPLGAVRLTEVFLRHDPPNEIELRRLSRFIDEKIEPVARRIPNLAVDRAIATSATAAAIVSAINRVPRSGRETADRLKAKSGQIRKLYKELSTRNVAGRRRLQGIGPRRAEIIIAGTAVFLRAMERLHLNTLYYSTAGLRDGIIADLAARGVGLDVSRLTRQQLRVVDAMCRKFNVDVRYARQVARFSADLFEALRPIHRLPLDQGRLLQAAAWLHDTGHFVSSTGHHKHSEYIVSNSDMPGFTDQERHVIAMLCRYHRKSLPTPRHVPYRDLSPDQKRTISMLTPLLRLAVGLDTSREQKIGQIDCQATNGSACLKLEGTGDYDLEVWATERAADAFRQIYEIPLTIERLP